MNIQQYMRDKGHEQLLFRQDRASGLRIIIAIHDTRLGPGLGGIRIRHYDDEDEAVLDALRLSEAMTCKNACAGIDFGGAKAVIPAPLPADRRATFLAVGRILEELGGRYVATEDMGMTEPDIATINEVTRFAVGRSRESGGSGDPSPHTADGVFAGMRSALRAAGLGEDFGGKRIAVQGCGKVGLGLVQRLLKAGAIVLAADTDIQGVEAVRASGAEIVSTDDILFQDVDVVAPCAVGAVINADSIPRLRCKVVAGAANNQLADNADAQRLAERGILYAPDFILNAGGVINVAEEHAADGYQAARVSQHVAALEQVLDAIFLRSQEQDRAPLQVAMELVHQRINAARS